MQTILHLLLLKKHSIKYTTVTGSVDFKHTKYTVQRCCCCYKGWAEAQSTPTDSIKGLAPCGCCASPRRSRHAGVITQQHQGHTLPAGHITPCHIRYCMAALAPAPQRLLSKHAAVVCSCAQSHPVMRCIYAKRSKLLLESLLLLRSPARRCSTPEQAAASWAATVLHAPNRHRQRQDSGTGCKQPAHRRLLQTLAGMLPRQVLALPVWQCTGTNTP